MYFLTFCTVRHGGCGWHPITSLQYTIHCYLQCMPSVIDYVFLISYYYKVLYAFMLLLVTRKTWQEAIHK